MRLELFRLDPERRKLAEAATNGDGRLDRPLLDGPDFATGEYEILFHAGDYLDAGSASLPRPRFLDRVPVRFGIAEDGHYHVPLLLAPHGYSTYRGS